MAKYYLLNFIGPMIKLFERRGLTRVSCWCHVSAQERAETEYLWFSEILSGGYPPLKQFHFHNLCEPRETTVPLLSTLLRLKRPLFF